MAARVRSVRNLKGMEIPHRARGRPAPTMKMLVTDAEAAQRTDELVELMPLEWRGDSIKSSDLGELREREDCKKLLKEITRAVPLRLLLDHEPGSLVASEKAQLTAPYFFLSTPVEKIGSFVSHRWAADPRQTALALMAHAKLGFLLNVVWPVVWGLYFLLMLTLPPLAVFTAPLVWNFVPYAVLKTRNPLVLRLLPNAGYDQPFFWFDKSTVHQKQNCLTQAGLSLFDYYLDRTGQITILFTEECAPPPFAPSGASLHGHMHACALGRSDASVVRVRAGVVGLAQSQGQDRFRAAQSQCHAVRALAQHYAACDHVSPVLHGRGNRYGVVLQQRVPGQPTASEVRSSQPITSHPLLPSRACPRPQ